MSKNLTVFALLLTTTRGSTELSCERERFMDVSMTELLIDSWWRLYLLSHNLRPNPREQLRDGREEVGVERSEDWK